MPSTSLAVKPDGLWLVVHVDNPDNPNERFDVRITPDLHGQLLAHAEAMGMKLIRQRTSRPAPAGSDEGFPEFWGGYPRKEAKSAALKVWRTQGCAKHIAQIVADVERRANSEAWRQSNGKFVPMATTYLGQRRWEDAAEAQGETEDGWL